MQSITSVETLHQAIVELEIQREEQEEELADHFMHIYESLRPVNIVKNTVRALVESSDVQHQILNAAIGLISGYLSRKLFIRSQSGPLKKLFGVLLQFGITNLVMKKGEAIKAGGLELLHSFLGKHNGNGSR